MKSESFKYTEPTRARVEREAKERMTQIYNERLFKTKFTEQYFPSISDQDVYGQTHTK
jgi:hypothetical protein